MSSIHGNDKRQVVSYKYLGSTSIVSSVGTIMWKESVNFPFFFFNIAS